MFDRAKLIAELKIEEGVRFVVYDDGTGKVIVPGTHVVGNPTVGIGHALNLNPFTAEETTTICGWDIDKKTPEIYATWPWLANLSVPRQDAIADLAFNMGVAKLKLFVTFLAMLEAGNCAGAAADLAATLWAQEVGPDRSSRIEGLIRNG